MDTHLSTLAQEWVAAWNARDLERVLALYTEDASMASPYIRAMGLSETGRLRGKDALRGYWGEALPNHPNLHFELKGVSSGPTASSSSTGTIAAPRCANTSASAGTVKLSRVLRIICRWVQPEIML